MRKQGNIWHSIEGAHLQLLLMDARSPRRNDGSSKDTCSNTALKSCAKVSTDTTVNAAIGEVASNEAAAAMHLRSTTIRATRAATEIGLNGATAAEPGAVGQLLSADATTGGNQWGGRSW
ncbi:hypothetical protein MRX96_025955 [Rhipicephalus microplus]